MGKGKGCNILNGWIFKCLVHFPVAAIFFSRNGRNLKLCGRLASLAAIPYIFRHDIILVLSNSVCRPSSSHFLEKIEIDYSLY